MCYDQMVKSACLFRLPPQSLKIPAMPGPQSPPLSEIEDPDPVGTGARQLCLPATRSFQLLQYRRAYPIYLVAGSANIATSVLRTLFQVPYPLSPLLATLTKTAGVGTNNSHFGLTIADAKGSPRSLSRLSATLTKPSLSVANKRLTGKLTLLDATLTRNQGWGGLKLLYLLNLLCILYLQKRQRPSRSDGGSCEKGVPSSGEKIVSTVLRSPKTTAVFLRSSRTSSVLRSPRTTTVLRSPRITPLNQLSGGGGGGGACRNPTIANGIPD